ncbi:DUF3168 domain-containing protein [Novosphingobium sp. PC22D]|uniref:DUF3168 domain-containing protein n=1 Tax=Novosphingobium sp. PC22D TaxID=1962403 RepID=UPI000BF0A6F9|nr:DUF3168 domain-containing protein [Novosphingobium sp. PC22D]PEQ14128.1 DUF3168 domain-containing protein [Novosphingobium sp. PC22D]
MEVPLRAALLDWLSTDAGLAADLNAVVEEAPARTSPPWLAVAASAATDWGCKTAPGQEVRVALELHCRGDRPDAAGDLVARIMARVESLPRAQTGFAVVIKRFLRSRAEQRGESSRAILIEYAFRLLADQ